MEPQNTQKRPFWKSKKFLYGIAIFFAIGVVGSALDDSKQKANTSAVVEQQVAPTVEAQQPKPKEISYQIVDRWTIPNGGEGKVIVISADLLNEAGMVALGNKIKTDMQNDRNAFISIFDSASSAALRGKVLSDKATVAEQEEYDKHFVGKYTKNGNTGFHQLDIYFDGVMGVNRKTIQY